MAETRLLPCKLTDTELDIRRDQIAQLVSELAAAEQARKDAAAAHRLVIDDLDERIGLVAREIREKSELRQVEVREEIDQETAVADTVRTDTGEVIARRALSPHERQASLFAVRAEG